MLEQQLEIRGLTGLEEKEGKLIGHPAVFRSLSHDLGGLRESIEPTAFDRTLKEHPDVFAFADHDPTRVLGRTTAGTLTLSVDERGLRAEILPPDTTYGRDLVESVRRGDVTGMSFGFRVPKGGQRIDYGGPIPVRHLLDVDLREVSVVTLPAYPDASVALRHLLNPVTNELLRMRLRLAE